MNPELEAALSHPSLCKCRCGARVKRNYLPGHDARHLSDVYNRFVLALEANREWYEAGTAYKNAIHQLPTEALKAKFRKRVSNAGWKYYGDAANSMTDQWFANRLPGLLRANDPSYDRLSETFAAGILACLGWSRTKVNHKFS